jgi:heptosyltransferase-2
MRILVVRFSSAGDVLLVTPLLRALRRRHATAHLAVLTRPAFASLISHNPHISAIELVEPRASLRALAHRLEANAYTHALDLQGSLRTRALRRLVRTRWSGYGKRRWARELLIRTKRDLYRDSTPEAERFFEAARVLEVTPDGDPAELGIAPEIEERAAAWLGEGPGDQPFLALAPGAAHLTKRWPVRRWETLARELAEAGHAVVAVGGSAEAELGRRIAAMAAPRGWSACGAFDFQGTGAIVRRATALASGDTGVMHIATAVRTPVVAMFGPTVSRFGFLPYRARAEVLERDLACRPCSAQGGPRCPLGHHSCLRDIAPAEVRIALERMAA